MMMVYRPVQLVKIECVYRLPAGRQEKKPDQQPTNTTKYMYIYTHKKHMCLHTC